MAQFAHNNWPSDTIRKSLFFLLMGYNACTDWNHTTSPLPQVTLCINQFREVCNQAQQLMIKPQRSWLGGRNLHLSQPMPKLVPRCYGPFRVAQVMSPVNYHLELPMQWSIHPVFHIDLLTPYCKTITHGPNYQCPSPDLVNNKEYKVGKILTLGCLAGTNGCNIWLNGRDILTWTTFGLIRMMFSQMIRCALLKNQTLKPGHI